MPRHSIVSNKQPAIYILASKPNGTLYTGVTSDLVRRVWEHKSDFVEGFTRKYKIHMLVYYEVHDTIEAAIIREKQIKAGSRQRKTLLIESINPEWNDLYAAIV